MKALIIVDMQNDFMPSGSLPVPKGDRLIGEINALMEVFPLVIATQDYHPEDHVSFVDNHPGKKQHDVIETKHGKQILWNRHCVAGTPGAELVKGLNLKKIDYIVHKGIDPSIDSYSAFFDNGKLKSTALESYLRKKGVTEIYLVGVALDYCVLYTALDGLDLGFKVFIIEDGCMEIHDRKGPLQQIHEKGGSSLLSKSLLCYNTKKRENSQ